MTSMDAPTKLFFFVFVVLFLSLLWSKRLRLHLSASRFSLAVTTLDNENSSTAAITSLACTRFKTKYNCRALFLESINKEDFHSISNTVMWVNGWFWLHHFQEVRPRSNLFLWRACIDALDNHPSNWHKQWQWSKLQWRIGFYRRGLYSNQR